MKIGFHAFAPRGLVEAINNATSHRFDWSTIFVVDGQTFSLTIESPVRVQRYTICIQECRGGEENEKFCYDVYGQLGVLTRIIDANKTISTATLMNHPLTPSITRPDVDARYYITISTSQEGSY